jgi:signal transduction histidine kinase
MVVLSAETAGSGAHSRRNGRNTWVRARFVAQADAKPGSSHYRLPMARTRLRNGLTGPRARLRRFGRPRPFVVDGLFALLLTVLAVAGLLTVQEYAPDDAGIKDPDALGVILAAMTTLPLAWRRRHPEQVLAAVGIATTLFYAAQYETTTGGVGVMVALYTVASLTSRRSSLISAGFTAAALAFILFVAEDVSADLVVSNYLIFGMAWILGDNIRTRRAYTANLEERAEQLERDHETNSRRAAAEERGRIAREMHDIVAHSVSVMVVQAGAARRVLEAKASPESATDALRQIEDTGRSALTDMRRMLGILRRPDEAADLSPQPSITRLESLIAQASDAGVPVECEVLGDLRPLPSAMDLSAYRIVQEALTNTIKHAGPARARVVVRYETDRIEIEVVDDGRGAARDLQNGRGRGHGLVGMKERAALYGGEVKAGPRPGGGYSVRATFPLEVASTR